MHLLASMHNSCHYSHLSICWQLCFHDRMASSRSQGGIQQLLAAEKEAQQIVNAAKSGIFALPFSIKFYVSPRYWHYYIFNVLPVCIFIKFCLIMLFKWKRFYTSTFFPLTLFTVTWLDELLILWWACVSSFPQMCDKTSFPKMKKNWYLLNSICLFTNYCDGLEICW